MKDAMAEALSKRKGAIKLVISVEPDGGATIESSSTEQASEPDQDESGLAPESVQSAPKITDEPAVKGEMPNAEEGESLKDTFLNRMRDKMKQRG